MNESCDSEEDGGSNFSIKVLNLTNSLNNLSIQQNEIAETKISDKEIVLEVKDDDNDGYKILYEASQRKLAKQQMSYEKTVNELETLKKEKECQEDLNPGNVTVKPSTMSKQKCIEECGMERNDFMLMCGKCKQFIHYECTKLPGYQITLFLQKSYRNYQCAKCIGKIPDEVAEKCNKYEEKIQDLNDIIQLKSDETTRLSDERCKQRNENIHLKYKLGQLDEHVKTELEQAKEKDSEIESLKKRLAKAEKSAKSDDVTKAAETKLQQLSDDILEKVTKLVDQKINYIDKKVEGLVKIPEKIEENCKTFKEVLRRNIPSSTASETIRTV